MKTDDMFELKCSKAEKTAKRDRSAAPEDAEGDGTAGTLLGIAVIGGAAYYAYTKLRKPVAVRAVRTMVPRRIARRSEEEPQGNRHVTFVPTANLSDFKKIRI